MLGKKPELSIVDNIFGINTLTPRFLPNGIIVFDGVSEQHWTGGGWEGDVIQHYTMIVRTDEHGNSLVTAQGKGVFTGEINGREGTLTYRISQVMSEDMLFAHGTTTILKGTGELKGIKGHGVLNFLSTPAQTEWYMHFDP